eukprot:6379408-Amphidinium_carterae.1
MRLERDEIAALDEQLWRTDQRLGQRITDLAAKQVALPASLHRRQSCRVFDCEELLVACTDALKQGQHRLMSSVTKVRELSGGRSSTEHPDMCAECALTSIKTPSQLSNPPTIKMGPK